MHWLIIGFLLALWILAMLAFGSLGGLVHILPVLASLLLLRRAIQGPSVVLQKPGDGIHRPYKRL